MSRRRRCSSIVVSAVVALLSVQAQTANAAEFAEGYSEGGTGYGVQAGLVIRRPGVAGGDFYDLKVGGRLSDGTGNAYVGYRVGSDAVVKCIYQLTGSRVNNSNVVLQFGTTNVDSQVSMGFTARSIDPTTVDLFGPVGCPPSRTTDRSAYNRIFVRAFTLNSGTRVSNNDATSLGYTTQYNGGFTPWGPPSIGTQSSSRVCQRFFSATRYNYSINDGCPV